MKKILFLFVLIGFSALSNAQTLFFGEIRDYQTGESLIGANILLKEGLGTVSDIDGKFSLKVSNGTYNVRISYVGYEKFEKTITITDKPFNLIVKLKTVTLNEVTVVSDVARSRETPIAFSNVLPAKISEELAGRDIPLILNSTPGVYSTAQGGGDGDARITIRGFNQTNVAVMIDGIPVNDMENGWVYWSNWFGLDAVTRTIQVQRGLGASKLALPSVGGTLNIITKGIENRRQLNLKEDIDAQGKSTTSFGFTSGTLKNGWGITLAGSYKRGPGWVDETWSKAYFFYAKIDKRIGNHIVSISAMGAPQTHAQRSYKKAIATYNLDYAKDLGIDTFPQPRIINGKLYPALVDFGYRYNPHWGYVVRDRYDSTAAKEKLSEKVNIYHKPQFSLRDYWSVNDKLTISNILYLSLGYGGGTSTNTSLGVNDLDSLGQINWQRYYDENTKGTITPFGIISPIDTTYSKTEYKSNQYIQLQRNEHVWYGFLSTANYRLNDEISLTGGIDLRSYTGKHYCTVYDLLGGDYVVDFEDKSISDSAIIENPQLVVRHKGDDVYYNYNGYVNWGGIFGLIEYKTGYFSSFFNFSIAESGYKKKDYYTATESEWKWTQGFTTKAGINYNLTEHINVFANFGYLSKVRAFKYFYQGYTTKFATELENEKVKAVELGATYGSPEFSVNFNSYMTAWENKPTNQVRAKYEGEDTYADIPGMDALHTGVELDFIYKIMENLDFQGLISVGNWTWNKKINNLQFYYEKTNLPSHTINFDATGIHVGDAAQSQYAANLRYEPIKDLYFSTKCTFFDRYYANFNPEECTDSEGNPVDSWQVPDYFLLDFHAGYSFRIESINKLRFNLRFNILNLLDKMYISDAENNDSYIEPQLNKFDAGSASVFFGSGRFISTSFEITF